VKISTDFREQHTPELPTAPTGLAAASHAQHITQTRLEVIMNRG